MQTERWSVGTVQNCTVDRIPPNQRNTEIIIFWSRVRSLACQIQGRETSHKYFRKVIKKMNMKGISCGVYAKRNASTNNINNIINNSIIVWAEEFESKEKQRRIARCEWQKSVYHTTFVLLCMHSSLYVYFYRCVWFLNKPTPGHPNTRPVRCVR